MKKLTRSEFIEKAKKVHGDKYDYSKVEYIGALSKIIIVCPFHGEFIQTAYKHLNGSGCHRCGFFLISNGNKKITNKNFIETARLVHGDKYDYSNTIYIHWNEKLCITCIKHGPFFQIPHHHLEGRGCFKCAGKHKTTKELITEFNEIHKNKYNYDNVIYKTSKSKIEIICLKHGSFFQTPSDHLNGQGCPKCIGYISKKEIKFLDYLNIPEFNRQRYICGYKVDGIRNNKIFEFLGDYWHGNPRKFNINDVNKSINKTYGELYNKTLKKFKTFKLKGYDVYYIWEYDWNLWNKNEQLSFPIKKFKIGDLPNLI